MKKLLNKLFKRHLTKSRPYWEVELERECQSYIWKQEMADRELERAARREAEDMLRQYQDGIQESYNFAALNPTSQFAQSLKGKCMNILIARPQVAYITVYPGQTSKYANGGYRKLVNQYFQQLKQQYEQISI
jgi:hypothetical protein